MMISEYNKETMAKASGISLPISRKQAVLVCNFIRYKNLQKAKQMLEEVMQKKIAVPYTRFGHGVAHRPGIGPGRYPITTAAEILGLLESAEANAQLKGLNTSNLVIGDLRVNRASVAWHYGRHRRVRMKRCHVDVILTEKKGEAKQNKAEKTEKKKEAK
jgi:large subunit ribosomal protein L22